MFQPLLLVPTSPQILCPRSSWNSFLTDSAVNKGEIRMRTKKNEGRDEGTEVGRHKPRGQEATKEQKDEGTKTRRNEGTKTRSNKRSRKRTTWELVCYWTLTNLTIFNDWRISEIHDLLMKTLTLKQTNYVIKSNTRYVTTTLRALNEPTTTPVTGMRPVLITN